MGDKNLGRPTRGSSLLSKDDILKHALYVLDTEGEKALSFRKLAKKFNVTAMALTHHVGTRGDILKSLVDIVYIDIEKIPITHNPKEAVRHLLGNYCKSVTKHPNLILLLLKEHSLINEQLIELTKLIRENTSLLVDDNEEGIILADLIIDYAHGFAIAAASQNEDASHSKLTLDDFYKGLDWILRRV